MSAQLLLFIIISLVSLVALFLFRQKLRKDLGVSSKYSRKEYIYFYRGAWELSNLPFVKIGRTRNIKQRISAARTSNPFGVWVLMLVVVRDSVKAESKIHQLFKRFRLTNKNEWFFYIPVCFYMWLVGDYKITIEYKKKKR